MKQIKSGRAMQNRRRASMWTGIALLATSTLAAAALISRNKSRQAERTHPPLGQFIEIDGVRLHYVERGQAKPLLLLHGNGDNIEDFQISGLLDCTAAEYRVIAFDRPGFGHSERPRNRVWTPTQQAEILHKALQQLGIERPIVVAHSWGTLVALAMAMDYPSDVRGLVLLSGYYYPRLQPAIPILSAPALPGIGDLMRYTIAPLLGRLMWPAIVRRIFGPSEVPANFSSFPIWISLRPAQLRASAAETALMIPSTMALRHRYKELKLPVMIVSGAADKVVNAELNSLRLHNEIPSSKLCLVPNIGHMVHYLIPEQIMRAICQVDETDELYSLSTKAIPGFHLSTHSSQVNMR